MSHYSPRTVTGPARRRQDEIAKYGEAVFEALEGLDGYASKAERARAQAARQEDIMDGYREEDSY